MNISETSQQNGGPDTAILPDRLRIDPDRIETKATRGEKATHIFAHWIVNFVLNYVLSIAITDLFMGHKPIAQQPHDVIDRKEETKTRGGVTHIRHVNVIGENPEIRELQAVTLNGTKIEKNPPPPPVTSFLTERAGNGWFGANLRKLSDFCRSGYNRMKTGTYKGAKALNMGHKTSESVAEIFSDIFTLMLGGHVTSSIATYILNRSDIWSRRFDKMFDSFGGKKPTEGETEAREARYEYLRNQPKKGAWTVIKSRILGFAINNVSGFIGTHLDWRKYRPGGEDLLEVNGRKLGIRGLTQAAGDAITDRIKPQSTRLRYWAELGLFEAFCTFNTSLALKLLTGNGKENNGNSKVKKPVDSRLVSVAGKKKDQQPQQEKTPDETGWRKNRVVEREAIRPRLEQQPAEAAITASF